MVTTLEASDCGTLRVIFLSGLFLKNLARVPEETGFEPWDGRVVFLSGLFLKNLVLGFAVGGRKFELDLLRLELTFFLQQHSQWTSLLTYLSSQTCTFFMARREIEEDNFTASIARSD